MKRQPTLESTFELYSQLAKIIPKKPNNPDLLYLYSHYKQATIGDCNVAQPESLINIKEKKKWEAWNSITGMTKKEAMQNYIDKVKFLSSQ